MRDAGAPAGRERELRERALSLGLRLADATSPSPPPPSLATDVELLAADVAGLPSVGAAADGESLEREEGWLVAAACDLRARVRALEAGSDVVVGGGASPAKTPARPRVQRFERTTLKFFMPSSSESGSDAARRLRLELGKRMRLSGPAGRPRLGWRDEKEKNDGGRSPSSRSSSSPPRPFDFDGRVTSVYFDEPSQLPALTSRGMRHDGASLVRMRWYGSGSGEASPSLTSKGDDETSPDATTTVWLERKVHRDPLSGSRSFKERVPLTRGEAATLVASLSSAKGDDPSPPSLAASAVRAAVGPGAVPLLRTEATRTAFEGEGEESSLRVTVDERVKMSAVAGGEDFWPRGDASERRLLFPFAIVEVKLASSSSSSSASLPPWLDSLLADPSLGIARAPRFSKALHAMGALSLRGLLSPPPPLTTSTAAFPTPSSSSRRRSPTSPLSPSPPLFALRLPPAAAAALPEVSRALLLAEAEREAMSSSSAVPTTATKRAAASFSAPALFVSAGTALSPGASSFASSPGRGKEGDFLLVSSDDDVESSCCGVASMSSAVVFPTAAAAAAATARSVSSEPRSSSTSRELGSPRPPPQSVFDVAAATSASASFASLGGVAVVGSFADSIAAAEEGGPSVLPPPKALPPIRTRVPTQPTRRARAIAATRAAVAAVLALRQRRKRKREEADAEGKKQKRRRWPSTNDGAPAATSVPPLLPTSFARAPFRVEPKVFFSNERTLIAWLQCALLVMLLATSLLSGSGGGGGKTAPAPSSTSASRAAAVAGAVIAPSAVLFMVYALFVYRRRARRMLAVARGSSAVAAANGGGSSLPRSASSSSLLAAGAATASASAEAIERFDDSVGAAALVAIAVVAGVATVASAFHGF